MKLRYKVIMCVIVYLAIGYATALKSMRNDITYGTFISYKHSSDQAVFHGLGWPIASFWTWRDVYLPNYCDQEAR